MGRGMIGVRDVGSRGGCVTWGAGEVVPVCFFALWTLVQRDVFVYS
jgi:hypothetical protein